MTDREALLRAAALIDETADLLMQSYKVGDEWPDDEDSKKAQAEVEEHHAVADQLRRMVGK